MKGPPEFTQNTIAKFFTFSLDHSGGLTDCDLWSHAASIAKTPMPASVYRKLPDCMNVLVTSLCTNLQWFSYTADSCQAHAFQCGKVSWLTCK